MPAPFPNFGRSVSVLIVIFKQRGNDVSRIWGQRTHCIMGYDDEMVVDGGMSATLMCVALMHLPCVFLISCFMTVYPAGIMCATLLFPVAVF